MGRAKCVGAALVLASGAVRVIYFNLNEQGVVVLVLMYAKADQANIAPGYIGKGV